MRAFVAAHLVHYTTVFYQAIIDVHHRLHTLDLSDGAVIVSGILLLLHLAFASSQGRTLVGD